MVDNLLRSSKRSNKRAAVSQHHTNTIINDYYSGLIIPKIVVEHSYPAQQDFSNPHPQQSQAYIDLVQIRLIKEVFGDDSVHFAVQYISKGDMNELLKFLLKVHRNKEGQFL